MKKYVIKNADGSEQTVMRAIHESRKEAGETLMDYICLSPFAYAWRCNKKNKQNPQGDIAIYDFI